MPVLVIGTIFLAGCGGTLQDELAADVGPPEVASAAAVSGTEQKGASIATASTGQTADAAAAKLDGVDHSSRSTKSASDTPVVPAGMPAVEKASLSGSHAKMDAPTAGVVRLPAEAASLTAVAQPDRMAYRIGPLDVLTVTVFRVPELSAEVQVADTGTINLPLIGDVQAVGRTAKDVEKEVTARLAEQYLQNPQVTIFIKEYNAQRVTVNGAVRKPGVFPLKGRTTLLQLISMAEGLDHDRSSSNVLVFRQLDAERTAARFDLDQIHDGTAADPTLEPGDVVIVEDSSTKIFWYNILRALPITNVFTAVL